MDLLRQLPRGRDDEGADMTARSPHQTVEDRQGKGRRLPGSGLGQPHDVVPLEDRRYRLLLDGRRREIADGLDPGRDMGVKIEITEFHKNS